MKRTWLVGTCPFSSCWPLPFACSPPGPRQPGYTDAYYYAVGAQLRARVGSHSSGTTSNLAARLIRLPLLDAPAAILGWLGRRPSAPPFAGLQAPFVLLAALLPLLAYGLAWDMGRSIARSPGSAAATPSWPVC